MTSGLGSIEVWDIETTETVTRNALPSLGRPKINTTEVDLEILSENLKTVLSRFQAMLDEQPVAKSGYCVDEIEVSLGVNAKGSIALIGKLEAGMQAGIKVKFKRAQ
ncbi:hypothetical protein A7D21_29390 [Pseudomonas sp. AP19]|uniref:Pepco domain-containing protein n=1 Tax=Pseudomonas TaxID=286 RepID=UPI00084A9B20|nr:hypothetical protein [Pseudomonas sp. AP19]OEC70905.1 hypothetical protein A7D21_29390 [Pseudomonas sp. AP19]